ncbi:hypothetical protein LZG04_10840 [Saccharothrix sp. S26]|uniref:hypothetical protein n=1 Tax=Saccharothrix sp. S26 TaxID=2907215 RepID=UPI001F1F7192|nr:hypothetical protein [Saccharothrix sp. S26]MCE6995303.1 hypothetical protein [Saccharothrix sp. S26]
MSLTAVQEFLAAYLRDPAFRDDFRELGTEADLPELAGLSEEEKRLVNGIDLADLDRVSNAVLNERFERTSSVYGLFLEHLGRYADVTRFYQEYDRLHTRGWWQRRAEVRRFEAFALDFVVRWGLPDHLVDLCRFCSVVTTVSESPKVSVPKFADLPGITAVRGNYTVRLREPFEVVTFRHDVLRIVNDPTGYGADPTPSVTGLLVHRDWREHKRSRVFALRDHPVLRALAAGPKTVFELAAAVPDFSYASLLAVVADLYGRDVVHLVVPREVAGELTTGTT